MARYDFIEQIHRGTSRNYLERVVGVDKAACAEKALLYGVDYWDGDRSTGYGGYKYDGRWRKLADQLVTHYGLKAGMRVLDVGCGKGFLLHDLLQAVPGLIVEGIDISRYAIENGKSEIKHSLRVGSAVELPYADRSFDLVVSVNALHNLYNYELDQALREIERVSRANKYVVVEGYRNEREKVNLMYWQLTCRSFFTPKEWEWAFYRSGYTGDYGFIFFE